MCINVTYLSGMETIGMPRYPEIRLKEGLTCHEREGKTGDPEHLKRSEGNVGFSETSRAEL